MEVVLALSQVRAAAEYIRPFVHRTPVLTCSSINRQFNAQLFFKCENFQRTGAFKFRGAAHAVASIVAESKGRCVATHSSGNHGAALSLAAGLQGLGAVVVMPRNANRVKRAAVVEYGGQVVPCEPTLSSREQGLEQVLAQTGAIAVHPYNDPRVIAGQGTAALELLEQVPSLDAILVPVGGGGLISGTALVVAGMAPHVRLIGTEPKAADDAFRSLQAGKLLPVATPSTVADGLRTSLGTLTFPIIQSYVHQIVCVSEASILQAMRLIWERMKIVIEPSAAVPVAALFEGSRELRAKRIGVLLSGGNVDMDGLAKLLACGPP